MHKKLILIISCLVFGIFTSSGQEYAVEKIDSLLLENAHAVIREYHTQVEIRSRNRVQKKITYVVTVLNERGSHFADLGVGYDSFRKVRNLKGTLYDKNGEKIRDMHRREFLDTQRYSDYALYSENRIIRATHNERTYPFTIQYEYTVNYSITAFLDFPWIPVDDMHLAAEQASFTFDTPDDFEFRHKAVHTDILPRVKPHGRNRKHHTWELTNIKAIPREDFMPSVFDLTPHIFFSPNAFTYGKYQGNMQSWKEIGQWINLLNDGKQDLNQQSIQKAQELTAGMSDTLDIIRAIYQYAQSHTRYVAILLGVGGYQPEPASSVAQMGYGECKALSNYTVALLNAAGIKAHYTLIQHGQQIVQIDPDFPSNYFNHVIVCVPLENDTIWLETTNQLLPMGFIGAGNMDRYALVVTDEGGVLTRTPPVVAEKNNVNQFLTAALNTNGIARISLRKEFNGISISNRILPSRSTNNNQIEFFRESAGLNQLFIEHIDYQLKGKLNPSITKEADFVLQNYSRTAGDRIIFRPLMLEASLTAPAQTQQRYNDFRLPSTVLYSDSVLWQLPGNYKPIQLPDNTNLETPFGIYRLHYQTHNDDNTLTLKRELKINGGLFRADAYHDFREFLREIQRADRNQVILREVN